MDNMKSPFLLLIFLIPSLISANTIFSKVSVKVGSTNFRCSFSLVHSLTALNTQDSSISCSPKNKVATANKLRLKAENGCKFVLSFKIRKGKGSLIEGTVVCPASTVGEPTKTTREATTPTREATTTTIHEATTTTREAASTTEAETTVYTTMSVPPPIPSEVESLSCGCSCDCPEDGSDCSCTCDCPRALVMAPPACSQGFTKVCPMRRSVCPDKMQELCPPNAKRPEEEVEEVEEVSDRMLTTVTKTVKISGKTFKCAISVSHGCVTTLSTNIKCSPGKPKVKGGILFNKDGYTFQVDFQTPSKVIQAKLLGVPCPKCSCKSALCSPACPTVSGPGTTTEGQEEGTVETEENTTTDNSESTTTDNSESTTTYIETTSEDPTSSAPSETGQGSSQRGSSDEGCSCIPNFMLFFSQRFLMQKNYEDNGFLSTCYCVQEDHYELQTFLK